MGLASCLTALCVACGGDDRPPPIGDFDVGQSKDDEAVDVKLAEDSSRDPDDLCSEVTSENASIGSGQLALFADDYFDPTDLVPLDGQGKVYVLGPDPGALACATSDSNGHFELIGATAEPQVMRIDPVGDAAFYPTLIHSVDPTGNIPTIPLFPKAIIDSMFDQMGLERDPNKAQVLAEVVTVGVTRFRHSEQELTSAFAEAVGYRINDEWSADATETGTDGLALLVNVSGSDLLGKTVRVLHLPSDDQVRNLWALDGAITYVAFGPGGTVL